MSEFQVPIRPRYGEVDSMGVVYHANYLVYFDVGRCEYMRSLGRAYADIEDGGHRLAVIDAQVAYRRPARYDDDLRVAVWLTEVRGASIRFEYELRGPSGLVLATGSTRLACLDTDNRPARLPADVFETLRAGRNPRGAPSESR